MTGLDRAALDEQVLRAGGREQHVAGDRATSGISSSGIARPPTRSASSSARAAVRLATTISRTPAPAERERHALAHARRRRARARAGRRASRAARSASATAADDTDTAWRPMRGLGAGPLADLDRVAERAREQRPAGRLALGRVPRLAHLAEDLALADDHRVEAGGHPEEVRDGGVVVVRVEQVGELVGVDARRSRRGSRARPASPGGTAWRGRRSRCGCTSRAGRPRRGARRPRATGAPWAARRGRPPCARAGRPAPCGGSGRRRPETCPEELLGFVHAPGADQVEHAGIEAPTANRGPHWNAPRPAALPGLPTTRPAVSRTRARALHPGAGAARSARAGLRPPVPMVTTRSPWRTTDVSVNEQLAGSSAEFTQTRRASPASNTARSTAGTPVAVVASQASSRSAGVELPLGHGEPPGVGPGAHLVADGGRDHVHRRRRRRAAPRSCGRRSDRRPRPRSDARRRRG